MTKQIPVHHYEREIKHQWIISFILILCLIFITFFLRWTNNRINELADEVETVEIKQNIISKPLTTTQDKIIKYSNEYKVDTQIALDIAECESQFGKYNYNWSGSSAKGIYQFIDSTWNYYCEGDVLNEDDNIKCFMEIYNTHPYYWDECNIIINN
jgi:hypothetical protein